MTGQLITLFQNGAAAAAMLYSAALLASAVCALGARRPSRRRDARKVLALLLHRGDPDER